MVFFVCLQILLPYFRDRNYILFIFDMGNKIVHILDPHSPKLWYSGLDPIMPYNGILEIVLNYFSFSMTLVNPAWKENVYLVSSIKTISSKSYGLVTTYIVFILSYHQINSDLI